MKKSLILKIVKEFLYGVLQVSLGSVETNFGVAVFLLMGGIVFLIIPADEKPAVFYFFGILLIFFSIRIFYLCTKQIVNKDKD